LAHNVQARLPGFEIAGGRRKWCDTDWIAVGAALLLTIVSPAPQAGDAAAESEHRLSPAGKYSPSSNMRDRCRRVRWSQSASLDTSTRAFVGGNWPVLRAAFSQGLRDATAAIAVTGRHADIPGKVWKTVPESA